MTTRTEMLEASDRVHYRITEVLYNWTNQEGNNLESFIDNPVEHVNYNPFVIFDYGKLSERLNMLREVERNLFIVTEYKKGNPDYTRSMYESGLDGTDVTLIERLLAWLEKRYKDMTEMTTGDTAPINDYAGMYKFNAGKFMEEYTMYAQAISGCKVVVDYKREQIEQAIIEGKEVSVQPELFTSNEPPIDSGG
jgi:hypothetical protein